MAMTRENRLLLIVVAVSAGTLLLLARLRFPGEAPAITPSLAPLERLAARATFDDLAAIVAQLQARVGPALRVLRVRGAPLPDVPALARLLEPPRPAPGQTRLVLAWRVRDDLLLAQLGPDDRVEGFVRAAGTPTLIAADPVRLVGLVAAPAGQDTAPAWWTAAGPSGPQYVAVAEATQGGPALRPMFLGRTDPVADPRWDTPLLALGGASVTQPGSIIFTLDGSLAGMTVLQDNLPVMAPTSALLSSLSDLEQGRTADIGDVGLEVSDVTGALADATGAARGALVVHVRSNGPSAGRLQVGDVITAIASTPTADAGAFRIEVARRRPGDSVDLSIVRRRAALTVSVSIEAPPAVQPRGLPTTLGVALRNARDAGAEVLRVDVDGAAERAGVQVGDLITDLDGSPTPTASDVQQAFQAAVSGSYLLLGITRADAHLVVAIGKP